MASQPRLPIIQEHWIALLGPYFPPKYPPRKHPRIDPILRELAETEFIVLTVD